MNLQVEHMPIGQLLPYAGNAKEHPDWQIEQIEESIDPFGGSGSTVIACEQSGRRCYTIELDPHYCDVILERWERETGREAVLYEQE